MVLLTTVGVAKVGTNSLRSTVPEGIVSYLGINTGDKLEWTMEVEDGERIVKVRKKKIGKNTEKIASRYAKVKGGN